MHQPGGGGCEEGRLSQTWMDHQKLVSGWQEEKHTNKDTGKTKNREGSRTVNIRVKMGQEASRDLSNFMYLHGDFKELRSRVKAS